MPTPGSEVPARVDAILRALDPARYPRADAVQHGDSVLLAVHAAALGLDGHAGLED